MIVVMQKGVSEKDIQAVKDRLTANGLIIHESRGIEKTILGVVGDKTHSLLQNLENLPGVEKVISILSPYKLASREFQAEDTVIKVGDSLIGGQEIQVMAGPCAVESKEQLLLVAEEVKKQGARFLRGGAFKPRTSPYAFQGLEEQGLAFLAEAREKTGLSVITEVMDTRKVEMVANYADILQIGARNMQNFPLLKEVAKFDKPVLLKRGLNSTIEEWIMAAEYIISSGNPQVILCERGIRTFETYTRNTLDLSAVPVLKHLTHLPVIVDPSHAIGKWRFVQPMARAAVAAGADGLLIEVHPEPSQAVCDGPQSITPERFGTVMADLRKIAPVMGRSV
ncbi:MAG: 3-deoxy-7-phosphoheptulonate synthase [Peptococcia bacterium]